MGTQPTKQTPNTLHSCYCPIGKPHPSFCPSFSLNTIPAALCICSLSEAEQIPDASKEIIFILCSSTTVHSAIPWVILHHRTQIEVDTAPKPLLIYQPAKIPSSYPTHARLCPKIYFKPLSLGSGMLRYLWRNQHLPVLLVHQPTWASELSAMGFAHSVLTPESQNTPGKSFGEHRINSSQEIPLQGKCTLTLTHLAR